MKVSTPMVSLDARGRLKTAVVFSIWRGLNYVRAFVVPTNPQTGRQNVIRGIFAAASRAWAGITAAQRTAWRDYSKLHPLTDIFGNPYAPSGLNAYVGLFVVATDEGETPVSDPPASVPPPLVLGADSNPGVAPDSIDVTWNAAADCDYVDIWVTPAISPGRLVQKNQYRHLSYAAVAGPAYTISGLTSGESYGVLVRGTRANGQAGPSTTFLTAAT